MFGLLDLQEMNDEDRKAYDTQIVQRAHSYQEASDILAKVWLKIGIALVINILLYLFTQQLFFAILLFAILGAFFCTMYLENYMQSISFKYWRIHDDINDLERNQDGEIVDKELNDSTDD